MSFIGNLHMTKSKLAKLPAETSTLSSDDLDKLTVKLDALHEGMSFGPYRMTATGLLHEEDVVCGPFEILGRARDPNGDEWARWIRFNDADERLHQVPIRDADLHGDPRALSSTLARQGLKIATKQRSLLIDYLNTLDVDQRITIVPRTGWHEISGKQVFQLPNRSYGNPSQEIVLLSVESTSSPYGERGSLKQWQQSVGYLCRGQRLGVLALSVAFAGPLLELVNQDGGGIHFRGPSSTGKTSLARAAASVWGPPTYLRSSRSTANGLEAIAALTTDTALVLDELGVIDARELHAASYQLAAGSGKGRARRDGSMRTPAVWRIMVISTGEVSIAAKIEEDRSRRTRAGQQIRMLDIPADAGTGHGAFDSPGSERDAAHLADAIKVAAAKSHGVAGPAFVSEIVKDVDSISRQAAQAIESFATTTGGDGQVHRATQRFGLIAFAGELACRLEIVPWRKGEATAAAEFALAQWLAARGGTGAAEIISAIRQVRLFIEIHGVARFQPVDNTTTMVMNRAGWRQGQGEQQEWLILPEVWKSEICAGLEPAMVAKALADRGMLAKASDGYQKNHRIEGRQMRLYTITARILAGLDDERGVAGVAGVASSFSEGAIKGKEPINFNVVTGATPATPKNPKETDKPREKPMADRGDATNNGRGAQVRPLRGIWRHFRVRLWIGPTLATPRMPRRMAR
jgi:putative DNA primase/helicase